MAKLISLEGAIVTIPSSWKATSGLLGITDSSCILNDLYNDQVYNCSLFYIGYEVNSKNYFFAKANSIAIMTSTKIDISNSHSLKIYNINSVLATNQTFIQWVLDNNATIEGGVWEEEHTVQIINPQMYILPPTKVVGNDLVVSAEEVVVNEAEEEVRLGTINFNQTSTWSSVPIHRSFEIGMTWEEFINSDYNKIQNDTEGSITISGQFILSGNYVQFYGKRTTETSYSTLNVFSSGSINVKKTDEIQDGYNYTTYTAGSGGGSN